MAKDNKTWIVILIIGFILIFGASKGWFSNISNYFSTYNQQTIPNPNNLQNEYLTYSAIINLNPTIVCLGQTTTGNINSNIPNGVCSIFVKSGSGTWTFYSNANLDANGDYSATSPPLTIVGPIDFIAVCCDSKGNCKMSNQIILTVRVCDNDGDGIPDDIDPDDDNDGWTDITEIGAGTDPLDPLSHPGATGCNAQCISMGYVSGRGGFESGSSCVYPEVIEYLTGESGLICCCMPESEPIICYDSDSSLSPFEEQLKTIGTCTDSTGSHVDYCTDENHLVEKYCGPLASPESEKTCLWDVTYNCPGWISGSHCEGGRCVM